MIRNMRANTSEENAPALRHFRHFRAYPPAEVAHDT